MIANARVLQDEFIPKEVVHRNNEVNILTNTISPILENEDADDVFIWGSSGTGKTCISRYIAQKLQEEILDIKIQYVNCWQHYNRYRVLYKLLQGINKSLDIHRQSTPKDELIERLHSFDEMPYLIILDEADQLETKKVLYDISTHPNTTTIIITNQRSQFFTDIDGRIGSRIRSNQHIKFDKYSTEELADILQDRARWGLRQNTINRDNLKYIADSSGNDARIAISILRSAARTAKNKNKEKITRDIINKAIPQGKQTIRQKNLDKLNQHQKILYEIIEEKQPIHSSNLYEEYKKRANNTRQKRTLRKYLNKMKHYNIIDTKGQNRWRKYAIKQK